MQSVQLPPGTADITAVSILPAANCRCARTSLCIYRSACNLNTASSHIAVGFNRFVTSSAVFTSAYSGTPWTASGMYNSAFNANCANRSRLAALIRATATAGAAQSGVARKRANRAPSSSSFAEETLPSMATLNSPEPETVRGVEDKIVSVFVAASIV